MAVVSAYPSQRKTEKYTTVKRTTQATRCILPVLLWVFLAFLSTRPEGVFLLVAPSKRFLENASINNRMPEITNPIASSLGIALGPIGSPIIGSLIRSVAIQYKTANAIAERATILSVLTAHQSYYATPS